MTYTDVFGGALLFPSRLSYLQITTAVDVQLQWPTEQQIEGQNVVADFLDISTTAAGLNVDFPDARNTSTGNKSTVNNIGGNNFTVRDATGGTIQVIGTGEQWVLVLTDNSTEAGTWSAFQLGAATTLASASALAGAGLQADGFGLLEQIIDSDIEAATPVTVVDGDRAKCLIYTAGAGTCNLPTAGSVGNNWFFMLRNSGSGTLNIVPGSGQIDGSANINLDPNGSTFIFTDGTDFYTIGLTVASTIAFDFVSIAVPGSGDFILTGANLDRISYRFTGALTGNRRIIVPNTTQQYWVDNQTTGAFTLEVTTAAGSGQTIPQGESAITYCDATDVINAVSSTSVTFPITVGQGGTSATNATDARTNLGAAFDGRQIISGAGLSGGGDLTADRTLVLDINSANTTPSPALGDFFAFEDIDDNLTYKATISDLGTLLQPDSLFDSGANVRAFAATGSNLQVRSDTNSDTVPRRLQFTHQDQTVRGYLGWNSFSEEMTLTNLIDAADGDILITTTNANAVIQINTKLRIPAAANTLGIQIRGTVANNAALRFTDTTFNTRVSMSFPTSDTFEFENTITNPGVAFRFIGEDNATITRTMLEMNPNTGPSLFESGVNVAQVLPAASGGFEINNTLQGLGFEQAATVVSGTFDVQLNGFTVAPTLTTFAYVRVGNVVTISAESAKFGTSNATTMTSDVGDVPADLRPTDQFGAWTVRDNGTDRLGQIRILSNGQIQWGVDPWTTGGFTASGQKGISQFTFTYNLNG